MSGPPETSNPRPGGGMDHLHLGRAIAVTIAFVLVAAYLLHQGGATTSVPSGPTTTIAGTPTTAVTPTTKAGVTTTTVARSSVKVQVANASTTAGVATKVTQQLQTLGWNTLPPVNATSQLAHSEVLYAPNRKSQADEIAVELQLPASSVAPLTNPVPVAGAAGDDVVVLIGPDYTG